MQLKIKMKFWLSVFLIGALNYLSLSAQDEIIIERTMNKVVINGQIFYIHVVKKGETLYSISKAYNVSQKTILSENPDALMGLQINQPLKIPFVHEDAEQIDFKKDSLKYMYHIIKKGQTIYFLTKEYDVSEDVIIKHNPELEYSPLQIDQVIKIPINEMGKSKIQTVQTYPQDYILHKVKRKETLYSLSKKYGVDMNQIVDQNNKPLKPKDLKIGLLVRIPKINVKKESPVTLTIDSVDSAQYVIKDTTYLYQSIYVNCDSLAEIADVNVINVALMLPLDINYQPMFNIDTVTREENEDVSKINRQQIHTFTLSFIEFYEGILLAMKHLKDKGISVDLQVFDTQRDTSTVKEIIQRGLLRNSDLIIGPFYTSNLKIVADYAKYNNKYVISPLANKSELILNNTSLFQVNPSQNIEMNVMTEFISRYIDHNLILIYENDSNRINEIEEFKVKLIDKMKLSMHPDSISLKEVLWIDSLPTEIEPTLSISKNNLVIIPSSNEAFVFDIVGILNTLTVDYQIGVFGMPSWQSFINIDISYFHDLEFQYYTPFYINFQDSLVQNFIKAFKAEFKYIPFKTTMQGFNYSYLGYDILNYFIMGYSTYGKNCPFCLDHKSVDLLMSDYNFVQINPYSGFENIGLYIVKYNKDGSITVPVKYPFIE